MRPAAHHSRRCGGGQASADPVRPGRPATQPWTKTGRRLDRDPRRAWATPLEVLLAAERTALLTGRETSSPCSSRLHRDALGRSDRPGSDLHLATHNVEWRSIHEIQGRFYRLPPKDAPTAARTGTRSPRRHPRLPLRATRCPGGQARTAAMCLPPRRRRTVATRSYSPEGGHYRRSNFAWRVFRPACDGDTRPPGGPAT